MKSALLISLSVIALIFGIAAASCIYALKMTENMTIITLSLPHNIRDIKKDDITKLARSWESSRKTLALFIKKDYIISADLAVHTLQNAALCGTECEYLTAKSALLVALETLSASLGFSPSSYL